MNQELPDIQARSRKGRGTRDQIANICWIIGKAREFHKNIYFSFNISPSNEYSGLISFKSSPTPQSLLQHCSSKASILWHSAFFRVQLSPPYGKN